MRFSVIITLYNKAPYIARALMSVVTQSKKPFEIIVVDDVSTDGSLDIVKSSLSDYPELYENIQLHVIERKVNGGPRVARNTALKAVTGDCVFLLNADDEYHSGVFEKAERVFTNYDPTLLFLQFERGVGGRVLPMNAKLGGLISKLEKNTYQIENVVAAFGHDRFGMNASSVVCKREALKGMFYQENLNCFAGFEYWYRVLKNCPPEKQTGCLLTDIRVTIHLTENRVSRKSIDQGGEIYLPAQFEQLRGSRDLYDQRLRKKIFTIWLRNAFLELPKTSQRLRFLWQFRATLIDNAVLNWRYCRSKESLQKPS